MKNLTIIAIAFFVSCSNPKAKIIEQIKLYKDSAKSVQRNILDLTIDESKKYKETFSTDGSVDLKKLQDSKITKKYNDFQSDIEVKKQRLKFKILFYKNKIDSLELELKKY